MTTYTDRIWVDVGTETYLVDGTTVGLHVLIAVVLLTAWGVGLAWAGRRG